MDGREDEGLRRRQSARLRRYGIAALTYLLWASFIVLLDWRGFISGYAWWLIGGIAVTNAAFWTMFRTDFNLRFKDPSLSMPMMLAALFLASCFTAIVPHLRGINLVVFLMVMMFGIFNLRVPQYLASWVFAVVGYGLAVWLALPENASTARLQVEALYFAVLAVGLFWTAFFGNYVGRLRDRLAVRNNELSDALVQVRNLAIHDDLTGVYNRRYLMEMLGREQQRALRHNGQFSLLMLDLDGFKEVNDSKGHAAGDEVLRVFVNRLRDHVRGVDVVGRSRPPEDRKTIARIGGEEFIAILPDTDATGAIQVAERIRGAVAAEPVDTQEGPVKLTVSIGVAEYQAGESVRDLLERVDQALYAAKDGGRNRVAAAVPRSDVSGFAHPASGSDTSTDSGK